MTVQDLIQELSTMPPECDVGMQIELDRDLYSEQIVRKVQRSIKILFNEGYYKEIVVLNE